MMKGKTYLAMNVAVKIFNSLETLCKVFMSTTVSKDGLVEALRKCQSSLKHDNNNLENTILDAKTFIYNNNLNEYIYIYIYIYISFSYNSIHILIKLTPIFY